MKRTPKKVTRKIKIERAKKKGIDKMNPTLQKAGKLPRQLVEELNGEGI